MKTIVFIEAYKAGSSREAIKAAEAMGYFTVLFTNKEKTIQQRREFPDVHEMHYHNLTDLDGLRKAIRLLFVQGKTVNAVVSFVDSYVSIASLLSEEFCQSKVPSKSVFLMEDKIETRHALEGKPYNPYYSIFLQSQGIKTFIEDHEKKLPLIVKSPKSTGSKDVYFVSDIIELETALQELITSYPESPVLLEEYLMGSQFLIEAVVFDQNVEIVAVIDQEITKDERFIVTGYSVLAEIPPKQYKEIQALLESLVTTFGLSNGCFHVELKYSSEGGWKIIEVNPRIVTDKLKWTVSAR